MGQMVSEKMSCFPFTSLCKLHVFVHRECVHVAMSLMLGSIRYCYILNTYGFRKEFLICSQNKSMGAFDPWGVASFDSRA